MYENKTYEYLLKRMLDSVTSPVDKREGSIIYDALAPAAAELSRMYIELDVILNETFADTASREYLIKRAYERGIYPSEPTYAVCKGKFNVSIPIGSRFYIDTYYYKVSDVLSENEYSYKLVCETAGEEPNFVLGTLIPVEYINGLSTATLAEVLIPGEDAESTENLRSRYLKSFNNEAFGGNREDYLKKVNAIEGVGGTKVYRAWDGGGTVKLVVVSSEFKKPTQTLVEAVQTEVDPTINSGEGLGIAPIDHRVTVFAADETLIKVETEITYANGWSFEDALPYIEKTIDSYLSELNKGWSDSDNIIVRISQIETRLLDLEAVIDIGNTKINDVASNFIVPTDSIAVRGDIIG